MHVGHVTKLDEQVDPVAGIPLQGFCDSDWAGDKEDRKSTSGQVIVLGGTVVETSARTVVPWGRCSRPLRLQRALTQCAQDLVFVRNLGVEDFGMAIDVPRLFCDSSAAIQEEKAENFAMLEVEKKEASGFGAFRDCYESILNELRKFQKHTIVAKKSKLPFCSRGHVLKPDPRVFNSCDVCGVTGTEFRCQEGCAWRSADFAPADFDMCLPRSQFSIAPTLGLRWKARVRWEFYVSGRLRCRCPFQIELGKSLQGSDRWEVESKDPSSFLLVGGCYRDVTGGEVPTVIEDVDAFAQRRVEVVSRGEGNQSDPQVERDSWDEQRLRALCARHGWDFEWMTEDRESMAAFLEEDAAEPDQQGTKAVEEVPEPPKLLRVAS
eukprot:s2067_g6.t1